MSPPRFVGPQGRGAMRAYKAKKRREALQKDAENRQRKEQEAKEETNGDSDTQ